MFSSTCSTWSPLSFTYSAPSPSTRDKAFTSKVRLAGIGFFHCVAGQAKLLRVGVEIEHQPHQVAGRRSSRQVMPREAVWVRVLLRTKTTEAIAVIRRANHVAPGLRYWTQARDSLCHRHTHNLAALAIDTYGVARHARLATMHERRHELDQLM